MMPALRCACALALVCLVPLLLRPEGALGEELHLEQLPGPRAAEWLHFTPFNKYMEKFFNSSMKFKDTKKSKGHKKIANATKTPPANATNPSQNPTKLPQRRVRKADHGPPPRAPGRGA